MINKEIINLLEDAGIKHSLIGFRYLITAIELGLDTPDVVFRITDLYSAVAITYNTTGNRVERSIRYSIKNTSQTNKEFISRTLDRCVFFNQAQ